MKIILRIGGSVLGSPPDPELLAGYSSVVSRLKKDGHSVGVVVGGGPVSREYIDSARRLGLSHREQDLIAIQASRLNARLAGMKLGVPDVCTTARQMVLRLKKDKVAVMGGLRPGITTDTTAAIVAAAWGADILVKASDQEGIFTADPRTDKSAKLIPSMSYRDLGRILGGSHKPGIHSIIDPVAVGFITRSRLKVVVVEGHRPANVVKAVSGGRIGTTVS
jgi:uridylate kinase